MIERAKQWKNIIGRDYQTSRWERVEIWFLCFIHRSPRLACDGNLAIDRNQHRFAVEIRQFERLLATESGPRTNWLLFRRTSIRFVEWASMALIVRCFPPSIFSSATAQNEAPLRINQITQKIQLKVSQIYQPVQL
jgi:hypothetical protein